MKKTAAMIGLIALGVAVAGCSSEAPAEPEETTEPAPSTEPSPAETQPEEQGDAHTFGETVQLEFDGSVWEVTIQQPADAPERLYADFPVDEEGTKYVATQGTITRVEGPPVRPVSELNVEAIVDGIFISDEYLSDDEFVSLNALPDMAAGGEATFTQVFVVDEGSSVETIFVSLGIGEAGATAVFGEPVDFGQ